MPTWAIVPVKPFREAKSRLSPVLDPEERAALSRSFLAHTLDVLSQVREVTKALVISRDTAALQVARKHGAFTVTESGAPELNAALTRATDVSVSSGADAVLIVPSDLPLLTAAEVLAFIRTLRSGSGVCIAPDRHNSGTNALFLRPPRAMPYMFGAQSFARHTAWAGERGLQTEIYRAPAFGLDVDLPEDWELFQASQLVQK